MSYEYSLDGYPPEPYDDRQLIRYAGAWAFKKFYDIDYEGIPKSSIIVGDYVLDVQTVTEDQTNLLCTVGQPYGEIIVLAALDLQEKRIRFLGWERFASFSETIYPPKLFANRLCNYIHTSRLKHMSLLDALLEIEPSHEKH
jgi:hypothetical protein